MRGIATSNVYRRLVSRALAKRWATTVDRATRPYQSALQARAGTDALTAGVAGWAQRLRQHLTHLVSNCAAPELFVFMRLSTAVLSHAAGGTSRGIAARRLVRQHRARCGAAARGTRLQAPCAKQQRRGHSIGEPIGCVRSWQPQDQRLPGCTSCRCRARDRFACTCTWLCAQGLAGSL